MEIYLPVAELSVNILLLLGLGGGVGFLSGLFGVGGGFLMTPLLIFVGIPPAVAVGTEANQIVASSVSGVMAHWRRGNVDFKMGSVLMVGGWLGSYVGVWLFTILRELGQVDLAIKLSYVVFLGTIGTLMLIESVRVMMMRQRKVIMKKHQHYWIHGLPLKMRFRKSRLYISVIPPLLVGALGGVLVTLIGVGGGFVMVPAMIYLLGMSTATVIGTSLFQIVFISAVATFLQAWINQTVDIVLAALLLAGGVAGAQIGARFGARLRSEYVRALLALVVLAVCAGLVADLMTTPPQRYSVAVQG